MREIKSVIPPKNIALDTFFLYLSRNKVMHILLIYIIQLHPPLASCQELYSAQENAKYRDKITYINF